MMPGYRYMDSYPHQRSQPGYQAFPTYVPVDPPKSPMVYESWPNGGSYGYPTPSHSCCNDGNLPGFQGFRPSYSQPMPSPFHYCGGYPAPYHEAYPVLYVPPPHYSAELPRYEFDKNMPGRYHCCGCPNHPFHQKGDRSLSIEEQEPDVVEKKGNDSLVPVQTKNYPYPVVWIPQEYEKEQSRPLEPEVEEQESFSPKINRAERKNSQDPKIWNGLYPLDADQIKYLMKGGDGKRTQDQEPKIWNGWYPLDADKTKYLMKGGDWNRTQDQKNEEQKKNSQFPVIWMPYYDGRRADGGKKENKDVNGAQDQKGEDKMRQFPFPIFWRPPQDKEKEEGKGKEGKEVDAASSNFTDSPPCTFRHVPMRQLDGTKSLNNSQVDEDNPTGKNDTEVKEKTATPKNIPVKHVDPHKEEKSEVIEKKDRVVPVKQVEDTIVWPAGINDKQSSSSPKSSKLPPVCLRVDPLPKKKNGSSRSPSPPGMKVHSQQNLEDAKRASVQSKENIKQVSIESTPGNKKEKEVETKKKEAKEIVVTQKTNDGPQDSVHSAMHIDAEVSEKPKEEKTAETKEAMELAKSGNEKKLEKKSLLDVEAALRIQSAYRGFEIRRSEPLRKLKQIAEVREQVADVQNHIQSLESSSDVPKDDKQKLLLGETIMRLLLKLDTIQGLHPSLRDIRKSLAKELVTLQERLDTLAINKSEQLKVDVCPVETVEAKINECMLKQEKEEETGGSGSSDIIQSDTDKLLPSMDSKDKSKGDEALFSSSNNIAQPIASEGDGQEPLVASDLKPKEPDSEAIVEQKDEVKNGASDTCAVELMGEEEVNNAPQLKQAGEVPVKEDRSNSGILANSFEAIDGTRADDHLGTILDELPVNVIDDEHVESEKDKQAEMKNITAYGARSSEVTLPGDAEQEDLKMNVLVELPVAVIDEDSASLVEVDDLVGKESECRSTTESTLPEDKTPNEIEKPEEVLVEKPIAETEECVKAQHEENQKLPVGSMLEVATGQMVDGEFEEHNERSILSEPEESQPVISMADEQSENVLRKDECLSADAARAKEVPMEKREEAKHFPSATAEKVKEPQETDDQSTNQSEFVSDEKMNEKSDGLEVTNEEVSSRAELLAPSTCNEISTDEYTMSKSDKQLMEENEKLREMMEKLLEAGKQQLNVITNLNGRVKDLEKKLSRRRKLRMTKQNKYSPCGASRLKRLNVPAKERDVGVAM